MSEFTPIKLLIVVLPRDKGDDVASFLSQNGSKASIIVFGTGTAPEQWSDLLGLGDSKKDVVLSIVPANTSHDLLQKLNDNFDLSKTAVGIAFVVSITSLSSSLFFKYCVQ